MIRNAKNAPRTNRTGVAYMATIGIAALVGIMSVGALMAVRSQARSTDAGNDAAEATNYAITATEMARLWIKNDSNWRANATARVAPFTGASYKIGNGTFTVEILDPVDGNLSNNMTDPVLITGIGQKGTARQRIQIKLNSTVAALTCLKSAAVGGNGVTLNSLGTLKPPTNGTAKAVTSNTKIVNNTTTSLITLPLEYVTTFSGTQPTNPKPTQLSAALTMPDTSTVFNYYTQNGTSMSYGSIGGSPATIQKALISPKNNPYGGGTNTQGIYVIDCQSKQILIQNCRIVGTLVLLNPGTGSAVSGSVNWRPAVAGYPCLLVNNGAMTFKMTTTTSLTENSTDNVNYNPPGTPDENGLSNSTVSSTDTYPCGIFGLTYVNGNVTTSTSPTVYNLVCSGSLTIGGTFYAGFDSTYLNNPPPGFVGGSVALEAGSYKKLIN